MKGYRYLLALALVAAMAGSVYMAISQAAEKNMQYEEYLTEARRLAELNVVEGSAAYYKQALALRDSVEVSIELGQVYEDNDWIGEAISWGEYMTDHFSNDPSVYTFLLRQYIADEDYTECFALRDEVEARDVLSSDFTALLDEIEYVYEFGYDFYDDVSVFGNGLCAVLSNEKWGYANLSGSKEIKCQFAWAGVFTTDEIAPVQDENGDFFYISLTGNKKIAVQNLENCDGLGASVDQILPASDNGVYAYYDLEFEKIAGDYDDATVINGGVGAVEEDGSWYLVDSAGNILSDNAYESVVMDDKGIVCRNERIFAETEDGIVMLDTSGAQIGSQIYEDAKLFLETDSYAAVLIDSEWGFVDQEGNLVIEASYEDARSFSNGYAAVEINGKWGFIDTEGNIVIEAIFQDARDFNEQGCVFIQRSNSWQMLKLIKENYD